MQRVLMILMLGLACCLASPTWAEQPQAPAARPYRIVMLIHGNWDQDPFWRKVRQGAEDAAAEQGVVVDYRAPRGQEEEIAVGMRRILNEVLADPPDGLIVSIPSIEAVEPLLHPGPHAPPLMTINSGFGLARDLHSLLHIGQPERRAGRAVGQSLAACGIHRAVCINHEPANEALAKRCRGIADELDRGVSILNVSLQDVNFDSRLEDTLDPEAPPSAVVALGEATFNKLVEWQDRQERKVPIVTFDPPDVTPEGADILFIVDQQEYLQGYLPVFFMTQHLRGRGLPQRNIWTGPALRRVGEPD